MEHAEIRAVKSDPRKFLDFMRENRYAVYHKSNLFFRDLQYGLWRFLQQSQSKVSYAKVEQLAREVVDEWERQGLLKRINRQSFELNMPEYTTVFPTLEYVSRSLNEKGHPSSEVAAGTKQRAPVTADPAEPATAAPAAAEPQESGADAEKAAKLAELQAKMAAAKAKREETEVAKKATTEAAAGPAPNTRARAAASPPVAGKISPAEKLEPSGVPVQEQRHNADPNAPQSQVSPPGETQHPESETGGVPASSLDAGPEPGTEEANQRVRTNYPSPPAGAGQGSSRQENDPNELPRDR